MFKHVYAANESFENELLNHSNRSVAVTLGSINVYA
jgi:hypothetical protein